MVIAYRIVEMNNETGEIFIKRIDSHEPPKQFTFDLVYGKGYIIYIYICGIPDLYIYRSQQDKIFNETAFPIVQNVMEGYNGTIFAYGQTGTGKTFTMAGKENSRVAELKGIMPRSFEEIFDTINCDDKKQYLVRASYLEIYKEEIRDLLSRNPKNKLELHEHPEYGVYVKDLSSFVVRGPQEINEVMYTGSANRVTGVTNMNEHSSRSHACFIINLETSEVGPDGKNHIRAGKLNMVDLAGSERIFKTGATGDRLEEATKINLSLSTLCHVISTLVEANTQHIPYRNSKLTRLLQDSLGGNTKTCMIANIGPADWNYEESLNTMRYANRAKHIKNQPRINEDPKDAMLREFQTEIQRLRQLLEEGSGLTLGDGRRISSAGGSKLVEKVIEKKVDDTAKIKELESKLEKDKEEIKKLADAERQKVVKAKNLAEEEKSKLLNNLKSKEEEQRKAKEEQQGLLKKLKGYEEKLLVGTKAIKDAMKKEIELKKANAELEVKKVGYIYYIYIYIYLISTIYT